MPLEDFKAVLGVDDRDDSISKYCLLTSTCTIAQYCKRRFLLGKHFERIPFYGELLLPLREYPVTEILSAHLVTDCREASQLIEPDFYCLIPICGTHEDIPFDISLSPALKRYRNISAVSVIYKAGYSHSDIPSDLKAACLELAVWNMNRYKSKQIGVKTMSNEKLARSNGSGFEMSMPENVKSLLEPYKRKTI